MSVSDIFDKFPGRDAKLAKQIYQTMLDDKQREEFAKLPVERQIGLLCVPVRRQTRYKKSGVTDYLTSVPSKRNPNTKITKDIKFNEYWGETF